MSEKSEQIAEATSNLPNGPASDQVVDAPSETTDPFAVLTLELHKCAGIIDHLFPEEQCAHSASSQGMKALHQTYIGTLTALLLDVRALKNKVSGT